MPGVQPTAQRRGDCRVRTETDQHEGTLRGSQLRRQLARNRGRGSGRRACRTGRARDRRTRPGRLQCLTRRQREIGHAEGPLHRRRERARHGVVDGLGRDRRDVPGHRPIDVVEREQLMRVTRGELGRDLRRDGNQRLLIEIGIGNRQHQIRGARPERREHDARLPPELAVDRGRDAGVRLVPHQHEVHARLAQFVDQNQHFTAGKTEDALDPRLGDQSGHSGRRRRHAESPLARAASCETHGPRVIVCRHAGPGAAIHHVERPRPAGTSARHECPHPDRPGPARGRCRDWRRRHRVSHDGRSESRPRAVVGRGARGVSQRRAQRGHRAVAAGDQNHGHRGLVPAPALVGAVVLRHLPGAVDRVGQRRADQRLRARTRHDHGRPRASAVGRRRTRPARRDARRDRRLRRLRERS